MPTHYLLPCSCGKKTEIDAGQAGLSVRCVCGTELSVPTMRGLAALERVESAPQGVPSVPGPTWGMQQGMMFLGGTIVVVAALGAFYFWWFKMPEPMDFGNYQENNRATIEQFGHESPDRLIFLWEDLRGGIERREIEEVLDRYDALIADVLGWVKVFGAIGSVGLLLVVVGFFMRPAAPARALAPARAV